MIAPETDNGEPYCCHCTVRRHLPVSGVCPTARATWGDVCSPARRNSFFDEAERLYET